MKPEAESKCKILSTASALFWEKSYGSVSVDDICEKAGVNKGSFYHFFPSKSDLGVAVLEVRWQKNQPKLDNIFSSQTSSLERFANYCEWMYDNQNEKMKTTGKVCGCPYVSLGCELSTQDEKIRNKSKELSERWCKYVESALRDAEREGHIKGKDHAATAREVFSYVTGVLMHAKINNTLQFVKEIKPGLFRLIGLQEVAA